jgi:hypothetical protein
MAAGALARPSQGYITDCERNRAAEAGLNSLPQAED